jgi:deoxyribodipyrimidine photo-lyase
MRRASLDSPFCSSPRAVVLQLVWLKRDLRIHDHAPLVAAASAGRVLPVFVHEPEVQRADDFSPRHAAFLRESLDSLHAALGARDVALLELRGSLPDVFDALCDALPIAAIHAHEETGNAITYARDRRVRAWAKRRGVPLHERQGAGVVRRLATRDGWHDHWVATMRRPCARAPEVLVGATDDELRRVPASLRFARPDGPHSGVNTGAHARQTGGREQAESLLHSFLYERGEDYRRAMSSPSDAELACSRISAHLAFGTLSNREAYHAARVRVRELRDSTAAVAPSARAPLVRWQQSLVSFASRLEWRDHFTQKLEDEPARSSTTNPASTGCSARCRPGAPASTPFASTTQ